MNMKCRLDWVGHVFAAMCFALGSGATLAQVNVTGAFRATGVGSFAEGTFNGPATPSYSLGSFGDSVSALLGSNSVLAEASQNTFMQAGPGLLFKGSGRADIGFSALTSDEVWAISSAQMWFTVTAPTTYSLNGSVNSSVDGGVGSGDVVLVSLTSGSTLERFYAPNAGLLSFSTSGTLAAGNYFFAAGAKMWYDELASPSAYYGGYGEFAASFSVGSTTAPVPEPEVYAMLAAGLGFLGWTGRRRRRAAA